MAAVSKAQVKAIHTLKGKAGLDEDSYRDVLQSIGGVRSSLGLNEGAAIAVIDRLRVLSGDVRTPRETPSMPGALNLSGPYAGICRALWISGWNLGVFEHREDTALVAFVKRQTRIDHLNWVRDADDARNVIEGLKAWLAREAGVEWPRGRSSDAIARKLAVVRAQLRLLGRDDAPAHSLDEQMTTLGFEVRKLKGGHADGRL